jgi:hypothetical protein
MFDSSNANVYKAMLACQTGVSIEAVSIERDAITNSRKRQYPSVSLRFDSTLEAANQINTRFAQS